MTSDSVPQPRFEIEHIFRAPGIVVAEVTAPEHYFSVYADQTAVSLEFARVILLGVLGERHERWFDLRWTKTVPDASGRVHYYFEAES